MDDQDRARWVKLVADFDGSDPEEVRVADRHGRVRLALQEPVRRGASKHRHHGAVAPGAVKAPRFRTMVSIQDFGSIRRHSQ